jgi:hypothetical protein
MSHCVPAEGSLAERLGLELHELVASGLREVALENPSRRVREMLASDPRRVFAFVTPATTGADGIHISVGVPDECGLYLARAANNLRNAGHEPTPADSAQPS